MWNPFKKKSIVEKLSLSGDDIIVLKLGWQVNEEDVNNFHEAFKSLGINNPVMILGRDDNLSVLRREER